MVGFWKALCCCCERDREKPSVLAVSVPNRKAPLSCGTRFSRRRGPRRGGPACSWLFALRPRRPGTRPQENGSPRPRCSVLCFSRSAELLVPCQDKRGVRDAGRALGPRRRREDLPGSSAVLVFADRRTRLHGRGVARLGEAVAGAECREAVWCGTSSAAPALVAADRPVPCYRSFTRLRFRTRARG